MVGGIRRVNSLYYLVSVVVLLAILVPSLQQAVWSSAPSIFQLPASVRFQQSARRHKQQLAAAGNIEISKLVLPAHTAAGLRAGSRFVNICHWSDFHAHIESSPSHPGNHKCRDSAYNVTRVSLTAEVLDQYCAPSMDTHFSLRLFTGDLMVGSEYDTVDSAVPSLPVDILKTWAPSAWIPGNHEFNKGWQLVASLSQIPRLPIIASNLEISRTFKPLNRARQAWKRARILQLYDSVGSNSGKPLLTICLYGVLISSISEYGHPASSYFSIGKDYAKSLAGAVNATRKHCLQRNLSDLPPIRILMSHIGFDSDKRLFEELLPILAEMTPNDEPLFHLVAGGHSHTLVAEDKFPLRLKPDLGHLSPYLSHTGAYGTTVSVTSFGLVAPQGQHLSQWGLDKSRSELISTERFGESLDGPTVEKLCQKDEKLFSKSRQLILEEVRSQVDRVVVDNMPAGYYTNSYSCRGGPCLMGELIAFAVWKTVTDYFQADLRSVNWTPWSEANQCPKTEHDAERYTATRLNELHRTIMRATKPHTIIALEAAGNLRSVWPPECLSPFQKVAGGCDSDQQLTAYDVNITLPFRSSLLVATLTSPTALCRILDRSFSTTWQAGAKRADGKKRSAAYLHMGGARVSPNTAHYDQLAATLHATHDLPLRSIGLVDVEAPAPKPENPPRRSMTPGDDGVMDLQLYFGNSSKLARCVLDSSGDPFQLYDVDTGAVLDATIMVASSDWVMTGGDNLVVPDQDLLGTMCPAKLSEDCTGLKDYPCSFNQAVLRNLDSAVRLTFAS